MAGEKKITRETVVSTSEFASVSGLTIRRIQQLIQDGVIPTVSKGKINLADGVQALVKQSAKAMNDEERKTEQAKRKAEAMLKASKAQMAKLEADELAGKMHRSEDIEVLVNDLVFTIRDAIMALPGMLAMDCAATSTPSEASAVIRREAYKILDELSNHEYDPKKYEDMVRERMEWGATDDDDE